MNQGNRSIVIAGNWKMNNLRGDTEKLLEELIPLVQDARCEVVACVPYTSLETAVGAVKGTNISIGAQNCHWEEAGAYTGEISPQMLKELGVTYVITGHSERRQYFGETDETVNKRTRGALDAGLKVIVCVGELLEEREAGITQEVCSIQTKKALSGISEQELENIIIAYEPVWAIGTGKTATAEEANQVNGGIRQVVAELYGEAAGAKMIIQYGGSMNPGNAQELLAQEQIDGGLIGGASLKADDFSAVIQAASRLVP